MKILGTYRNGNYMTTIFDDGTKIRHNKENEFIAEFPECMDVKITNYCNMNCPMCHECSTTRGRHGDILNQEFINTLHPLTELAIGGGNPLSHPDLIEFLKKLKDRQIIANMTINVVHLMENTALVDELIKEELISGLGISLPEDFFANKKYNVTATLDTIKQYPNAVIHLINGIHSFYFLQDLYEKYDKTFKILLLGFKNFGRGVQYAKHDKFEAEEVCGMNISYIQATQMSISTNFEEILKHFKTVSFDNLALSQLVVKERLTEEEWNKFYMGDDGKFTMYIDLVKQQFARCSIANKRYKILNNIKDMFKIIREEQ